MRLSSRRSDDADVIRARLRLLLAEREDAGGWVPEDLPEEAGSGLAPSPHDGWSAADAVTAPLRPEVGADGDLPGAIGRHRAPGAETRWDPGRPGARALWGAAVLAALLLGGWTWLERPQVEPVEEVEEVVAPSVAPASPTVGEVAEMSETVVVSVVGQVVSPGLVTLPSGSRVADALAAAGGLLPGADPASVNLAAVVSDGEQLAVGLPGEAGPTGSTGGTGAAGGRVDLNAADVAELDALPGIGPVLAQRIVEHRSRHGPFRSVAELDDVAGIGPAIAAELAELVAV